MKYLVSEIFKTQISDNESTVCLKGKPFFFTKITYFRLNIPKHWPLISKKDTKEKKDRIEVRMQKLMLFVTLVEKLSKNGIINCTTKVHVHLMLSINVKYVIR